jgi:Trk K+ transport system NAD-binding subunit
LLLREFAWPLLFFVLAMVGGGLLYSHLSELANQKLDSRIESLYMMLSLTFLQPYRAFPDVWYLQLFYFLMPVVGIGILAQGLADFGVLFFNRHARGKEWMMAVASTFDKHIVLVGLGHLGFRVMIQLHNMGKDIVVIEMNPKAELLARAQALNVPVLADNGKLESVLRAAGIAKARTVITCTQNDSLNLEIAFKSRRLNPSINAVLRIFDDELAELLQEQFGFRTMSATGMSAPMFAAAAAGVDITRPITVEGEALSLASVSIELQSNLVGYTVGQLEQDYDVSVVLLRHDHQSDFHPDGERVVSKQDVVAVLGGQEQINRLANANQN